MIKIFFCFFLLLLELQAFEIKEIKNTYNFNDFTIYEDTHKSLYINDIVKIKNEFKKSNKTNTSIKKYPIWSYGKILNNTNTTQRFIFTNPRAGVDFMDVYIVQDEKLIKKFELGDMNPLENRTIQSRKSNFLFELEVNTEYEFFIRYKSFGAIDTNLEIYQPKFYANIVKKESMNFGLIIGFVTFILIVLLLLLFYFPSVSTTLFFFILLGSVAIQLSVAGVFYEMGLNSYLNTIISWSIGNIAAAFIGLFPIYYFNLKKIMPKMTKVLILLSSLLIALSLSFFFYPFHNELLYLAPFANLLFFIITLVLVYVSINLYIKKIDGYKIYIFGNLFFLLCVVYFILELLGLVSTNKLFYSSLIFGTFVNIACLGYLIFSNLMKIKKEKDEALILLNKYSKLSTIGQAMINISHQWKEPINHIYYSINNIQAAKEFKDPNLEDIINKSLQDIKNTTLYMQDTGRNFLSLYEEKSLIEDIDIVNIIHFSTNILKNELDKLNVDLKIDIQIKVILYTDKYLIANVFLVILENSIKIFKQKKIKKPYIHFVVKQDETKIQINICDNGGGIKINPIENIFKKDYTDSNSSGIGLYLAKNILNVKLNGDIFAKNTDNGVCFEIIIEKNN